MAKKGSLSLVADKVGRNYSYVRTFINDHPELGIVKNENNKFVLDEQQQEALCEAIQKYKDEQRRKKNKANTKRKMSEQEKKNWDELYEYVRSNVFEYTQDQALSPYVVLRLKGLLEGKACANNLMKSKAKYTYKIILNTFKYCMPDIKWAIHNKSFKDESSKFSYIMRIIESNINTVYARMESARKAKEEAERISAANSAYETANNVVEYKPVAKADKKNKFSDLW